MEFISAINRLFTNMCSQPHQHLRKIWVSHTDGTFVSIFLHFSLLAVVKFRSSGGGFTCRKIQPRKQGVQRGAQRCVTVLNVWFLSGWIVLMVLRWIPFVVFIVLIQKTGSTHPPTVPAVQVVEKQDRLLLTHGFFNTD